MRVALGYRQDYSSNRAIQTYANSIHAEFVKCGFKVTPVGQGHDIEYLTDVKEDIDLLLDLDCGRNREGEFRFQGNMFPEVQVPKAVWFIDNHGQATLFRRIGKKYNHVFFAVWSRRDLFENHPSAHWCPNYTDLKWFGYRNYVDIEKSTDFGFFGSRGGLHRADKMKEICEKKGWTADVRQCGKAHRHKWPRTAEAMATCNYLFNKGQKHDGPNLRVIESMAMKRPLLTDIDPRDGMSKLFVEGYHYVGYNGFTFEDLEEKMDWALSHPVECLEMADKAYKEVVNNHTVASRVNLIIKKVRGKKRV
jgi:spore maturation protein CgeB